MDRYVLLNVDVLGGLSIQPTGNLSNGVQVSGLSQLDHSIRNGGESELNTVACSRQSTSKGVLPRLPFGCIAIAFRSAGH